MARWTNKVGWFGIALSLLACWALVLLAIMFANDHGSIFRQAFIENQFGMGILAMLAGSLVACVLGKCRPLQIRHNASTLWYRSGIAGVYFLAFAVCMTHNPSGKPVAVIVAVVAGVCFIVMVWGFFKARQQFTLRTLFLVTTGFAVLCSAAHYIPIAPLVVFLAAIAMQWVRPPLPEVTNTTRSSGESPSGTAGHENKMD
jgi:hypothetical protein